MTEILHDSIRLDAWKGAAADLWLVTAIIQLFKLDVVTLVLEALLLCTRFRNSMHSLS